MDIEEKYKTLNLELDNIIKNKVNLAKEYFKNLYPNCRLGDFLVNQYNEVIKIEHDLPKFNPSRGYTDRFGDYVYNYDNIIEKEFCFSPSGYRMTDKGIGQKYERICTHELEKGTLKKICSEEEYKTLAIKYKLPINPNRKSLLKLNNLLNANHQSHILQTQR